MSKRRSHSGLEPAASKRLKAEPRLPPYVYAPLRGNEIRLVQLLPGAFEDDIHLCIVHEELAEPSEDEDEESQQPSRQDVERGLQGGWKAFQNLEGRWLYGNRLLDCVTYDHPNPQFMAIPSRLQREVRVKYEALSYAWGDTRRQQVAYIKAHLDNKTKNSPIADLPLTNNLDVALRYLRSGIESYRTLWIDAICIDQDNESERDAQVSRIPSIYSQAHRAVVWLGPESENSKLAMETLNILGQQIEVSSEYYIFSAPGAIHSEWWHPAYALPYSNLEWTALLQLLQRPFFERLWVLQEMAVADANTTLWQCGHDLVPWHYIRRAIVGLGKKYSVPTGIMDAIQRKQNTAYGIKSWSTLDVVDASRGHKCSDLRDKIYGMMAFLSPQLRQVIQPSYEMAYEKIYQEAFIEYSNITGRLDLLAHCWFKDNKFSGPSWVPDLTCYPHKCITPSEIYQASGKSSASFEIITTGPLAAKGRVRGQIIKVHQCAAESNEENIAKKLDEILPKSLPNLLYITGESMLDALVRILSSGFVQDRYPDGAYPALGTSKSALLHFWESTGETSEVRLSKLDGLLRRYRDFLEHMSFFTTGDGYSGFAPTTTQEGDFVCVLLGLFTPLVIRPAKDGCFQVVGWCYMHGLMDGEALLGPLPENWTVEVRYLSVRRGTLKYKDLSTHTSYKNDPRLEPLPDEWHRLDREITPQDPPLAEFFENFVTGEVINYDPRMTADALERRGVTLDTVRLV